MDGKLVQEVPKGAMDVGQLSRPRKLRDFGNQIYNPTLDGTIITNRYVLQDEDADDPDGILNGVKTEW